MASLHCSAGLLSNVNQSLSRSPSSPRPATTTNRYNAGPWSLMVVVVQWLSLASTNQHGFLAESFPNLLDTALCLHDHRGSNHNWRWDVLPHISPSFTKETSGRAPVRISLHPPWVIEAVSGCSLCCWLLVVVLSHRQGTLILRLPEVEVIRDTLIVRLGHLDCCAWALRMFRLLCMSTWNV